MPKGAPLHIAGILLAAGRGARFDSSGKQNKLLQVLASGDSVARTSARHMLAALPTVLAAVRPGNPTLAAQLAGAGCRVAVCATAEQGMGATLAFAMEQLREADAWLIALADMPSVQASTLQSLRDALQDGADIVQPTYRGAPGNPVGFSRLHLAQLLQLGGDQGARALLKAHPVTRIAVEDPGILQDIDTPADLPTQV
jgi:molybdenum cofactor cytidylyltransferase